MQQPTLRALIFPLVFIVLALHVAKMEQIYLLTYYYELCHHIHQFNANELPVQSYPTNFDYCQAAV